MSDINFTETNTIITLGLARKSYLYHLTGAKFRTLAIQMESLGGGSVFQQVTQMRG